MLIAFAIGSLLPLMSPGIWGRIAEQASTSSKEVIVFDKLYGLSYSLLRFNCHMVILWVITLIMTLKRRRNLREYDTVSLYLIGIIITSVVISGFSGNVARSYWISNILSIVLFGYVASKRYGNKQQNKTRKIIMSIFTIFVMIHMCYSIYWQYRLKNEFEDIKYKFIQSENGMVYHDLIDIPSICLDKPLDEQFCRWWLLRPFGLYYGIDGKDICVVPHELEKYEPEEKDCISDSLRIYKTNQGHIIIDNPTQELVPYCQICFDLKNGKKKIIYMDLIEYQNSKGETYYYCSPYNINRNEMADIQTICLDKKSYSDNLKLLFENCFD